MCDNGRLSAALDLTAKQTADIRNTCHDDNPEIAIEDLVTSQRCEERASRIRMSGIFIKTTMFDHLRTLRKQGRKNE